MRTYSPKPGDIERQWHLIDASDVVLGRLASHTANLLRGKHKPTFAPHMDTGDYVVIINAGKVALTGKIPAGLDCTYSLNYLVRREPGITPPPAKTTNAVATRATTVDFMGLLGSDESDATSMIVAMLKP